MQIKAPRGTRDILPPASSIWNYIENKIRKIYTGYNYKEIRTPLFEETELFVRGVGAVTDIVEKEMYTFTDKGGRSLTLRPEGTAPVVRSYLEHKLYGQVQPFKFYYLGPMFRYERPQAGRYRQHYQTGVEVLGGDSPYIDAEVINLGLKLLEEFNLTNWELHLNSIGCYHCRPEYIKELKLFFNDKKDTLCDDCRRRKERNPLRVLDCKNTTCRELLELAPIITDYLCGDCREHFERLKHLLQVTGRSIIEDPFLVRGLDYYTRTAFEVKAAGLGAQDTIFGGGRYDGLAEELGGPAVPGMGFGFGLDRLMLALEEESRTIAGRDELHVFIVAISAGPVADKAWLLTDSLRKEGLKVDMDLMLRTPRAQFKQADRLKARYTVIIGEDELKSDTVQIKDMHAGGQQEIKMDEIIEFFLGERGVLRNGA